jgi:LPXTG-motif cell wall-anchored protein
MKLTWTNTEWDNFSGVASQDNLLMLNAGDDFLNATGDNTMLDDKEIIRRIRNLNPIAKKDAKWNIVTDPTQTQINGAKAYYNGILKYDAKTSLDVLNSLLEKAKYELTQWKNQENTGKDGIRYSNSTDKSEISTIQSAGKAKANIKALESSIIPDIETAIAKAVAVKEKADADAKAKADAMAKAKEDADAKAKADADKAKMKTLTDQLIVAKTPEERARIQAEIDALAGNVAKATGSSKLIIYGVVGLAIIGGAYMLLRRK